MKSTMHKAPQDHRQPGRLGILLAVLVLLPASRTQGELISDFDDGVPDWDSLGLGFGEGVFEERDGHLAVQFTQGNTVAATWRRNIDISEGAAAEVRLDLIGQSGGGVTLGFKGISERGVEVGYYAMMTAAWVGVIEYRLGLTGAYDPEWTLLIPQQFHGLTPTDVTYGLTLTGKGDAVEVTLSIWDRTPERNLMLRKVAVDEVHSGGGSLDLPFKSFSGIFVGMLPLSNPGFPLHLEVDNLELDERPALKLSIRPAGNDLVEVRWPGGADLRYRLYRSVGDLEHFFPFSDVLQGTGDWLSRTDTLDTGVHAFYKYSQPPASKSPGRLTGNYQAFRDVVINQHNRSAIPFRCGRDVCYEDIAELTLRNRQEMQEAFASLWEAFPDYRLTGDAVLTAENLVTAEAVAEGTQSGDWNTSRLGLLPATGRAVRIPQLAVVDFEGDQIVRYRVYQDLMEPMIQLGILPPPELSPLVPSTELPAPAPNTLGPAEVITRNAALWNAAELPAYAATYREDADIVNPGFPPGLSRAEYAAVQEGFWTAFPDHHMEIVRLVELGEGWVLIEALWEGTNTGPYFGTPATGRQVVLRGAILSRVDESGLIHHFHIYFDNLTMLGQLGLLPPVAP